GFARPGTGSLVSLALPRVTAEPMGVALAALAARVDPDGRKLLVVLVDNAGWHVAKRLVVPAHVVLHRLPPCTPERQPVDPLWPLLREAVANRAFERLAQLRRVLRRRCTFLAARDRQGSRRLPLGSPLGTIRNQCNSVSVHFVATLGGRPRRRGVRSRPSAAVCSPSPTPVALPFEPVG